MLLEEEFSLFPFRTSNYVVELAQKWISYKNARNEFDGKHYIHFGDVTGCRCRKSKAYNVSCFLTVYYYPICQKSYKGKRSREKQTVTFDIHSSNDFDENLRICLRWRNLIMSLSRNAKVHKQGKIAISEKIQHAHVACPHVYHISECRCEAQPHFKLLNKKKLYALIERNGEKETTLGGNRNPCLKLFEERK